MKREASYRISNCQQTFLQLFSFGIPTSASFLLLVSSLLCPNSVFAEIRVECYDCVWQSSSSAASKSTNEEFCRPGSFKKDMVKRVICTQGCITTSMFENDPDGPVVTTLELRKNASDNAHQTQTKPPMSFFMRGCPSADNSKKPGCEEKSYFNVYREECFCTSPLCNTGAKKKVGWIPLGVAATIMVMGVIITVF